MENGQNRLHGDYRSVWSLSSEETYRKRGTDIYSHWPEQGAGQACLFLGDGYRAPGVHGCFRL